MFDTLRELFHHSSAPAISNELQLAAAAVLLSVARADSNVAPEEQAAIKSVLQREFHLSSAQAAALLGTVEKSPAAVDNALEEIRSGFSLEQKQVLLAAAWKVIGADKDVQHAESQFAVELRTKLGLSLEQAIGARRLAEGGADVTIEGIGKITPPHAH